MSYSLSVDKESKVVDRLEDYIHLLYGREGLGKTALESMFPGTWFWFFEPGGKSLSVRGKTIKDWSHVRAMVKQMIAKPKEYKKIKRIVFDTADLAWEMCERWTCEKMAIDDLADEDWGKGFKRAKREFHLVILDLLRAGYGVGFTSHSVMRETENEQGEKTDVMVPTMAKSARSVIEPLCDLIIYMHYRKGNRVMTIRGSESLYAKCRLEKNFKGIKRISMGKSKEEAYDNLKNAFKNKV